MEPRNQLNRQSTKKTKCKSLHNNTKRRRGFKSVAKQTAQDRTDSKIKIMICSAMFLYSEERKFTMISLRLQKAQPGHNKGQDTTTSNWRSNRQVKRGKILQQA